MYMVFNIVFFVKSKRTNFKTSSTCIMFYRNVIKSLLFPPQSFENLGKPILYFKAPELKTAKMLILLKLNDF